jgi:hypothetical protein
MGLLSVGLAAFLAASVTTASAEPIAFGPDLSSQGWKTLTFRSLAPVEYSPEGSGRLLVRGKSAASLIWLALDEKRWPARNAAWRWRVRQGVVPTDLSVKGGDDRSIALYFVFARDEAAARSAKGSSSLTSAMWWSSGAALTYVWGGNAAPGRIVSSPHMGSSGKLIVRQSGTPADGKWISEEADLTADFRRAFGRDPGPLVGIAISADSDDTKGAIEAAIEGLRVD